MCIRDSFYAKRAPAADQQALVRVGRVAAAVAVVLGMLTARPLLGSFDQAFQYIQEYTGFFTPGIVVIFVLGLFWKRANEAGALAAAIGSFVLSIALKLAWPALPFLDRVGLVFVLALVLAVGVSLSTPAAPDRDVIAMDGVEFATGRGLDAGAVAVLAILAALYTLFW
jgi:SSS family solute:Na+ symporter